MVIMNATEFFNFEIPTEPEGVSKDDGLKLMPRNNNGAPKLIARPSQNGFD